MFKVDYNKKITITEGDTGYLKLSIPNYKIAPGDTIYFRVKAKDHGYLFQKVVTGEEHIENGMATIKIEPQDTKSKELGVYLYDIQLTRENKDIFTVVGPRNFEIMEGITNE